MKSPLALLRRLAPAAAALSGALVAAPALAGTIDMSQMQDVARMVSLGGSSLFDVSPPISSISCSSRSGWLWTGPGVMTSPVHMI